MGIWLQDHQLAFLAGLMSLVVAAGLLAAFLPGEDSFQSRFRTWRMLRRYRKNRQAEKTKI